MRKFIAGFALGVAVSAAATVSAAQIVGKDNFLLGWTVTKDGEQVCISPWVWTFTKQIECH